MSDATADTPDTLYTHKKRPQWGRAIIAWEGKDRRGYQFEDGHLRTFSKSFDHFMEPDSEAGEQSSEVIRSLKAMVRKSGAYEEAPAAPSKNQAPMTFEEQVEMFRLEYPGGFQGEAFREKVRGEGATRHLKRHRDGAVAKAASALSAEQLSSLIEQQDYEGVRKALTDVMEATDMVSSTEVKELQQGSSEGLEQLATGLRDWLHGDGTETERFDAFAAGLHAVLGKRPSWQLATVPGALVHPSEQVCVSPNAYRKQARSLSPSLRFDAAPTGLLYDRLRAMALQVRDRLVEAGMEPKDLIDVYDFIWTTQRPSAKKLLHEVRARRPAA